MGGFLLAQHQGDGDDFGKSAGAGRWGAGTQVSTGATTEKRLCLGQLFGGLGGEGGDGGRKTGRDR